MDSKQGSVLDFFKRESVTGEWLSGFSLGKILFIDTDKEKQKAGGVPNGSFLMAYSINGGEAPQALLFRIMKALHAGNGLSAAPNETVMECRVLGTIYRHKIKGTCF